MQSEWYKKELEEYKKTLTKNGKSSKKSIIGATIVCLLAIAGVFFAQMNSESYDGKPMMGFIAFIYVMVVFVSLISSKNGKKLAEEPDMPEIRKDLEKLLTTPEQIQEFDSEMLSDAKTTIFKLGNQEMFYTEHYLVESDFVMGKKSYIFARLSEIASFDYSSVKDAMKMSPLAREYYVDLLDANGNKMTGMTVHGKKEFEALQKVLEK